MSQLIDNSVAQNPRMLIVTALITAVTTIGAAFLGVVPQLRSGDRGQISELQQQIVQLDEQIKQQLLGSKGTKGPKTMNIVGTVFAPNNESPLSLAEIYLVPMQNPKLLSRTDENGEFKFPDVPDGQYYLIVHDTGHQKKTGISFIDKDGNYVKVDGAKVRYHVEK